MNGELMPTTPPDPKPLRKSMTVQGAVGLVVVAALAKANTSLGLGLDGETLLALATLATAVVLVGFRRALGGLGALLLVGLLLAGCCGPIERERDALKSLTGELGRTLHLAAGDLAAEERQPEVVRRSFANRIAAQVVAAEIASGEDIDGDGRIGGGR